MKLKESKRKNPYDKETDQPKKYVAGLSDKDKKAHDKHLEKQGKKSDSDKSAYVQSPADKKAKTKPSKHTKRFKQMYGELKTKSEKEPEKRGAEFNTDGIPEAYEIGHDWAKYTSSITPGEKHYNPKYQGGSPGTVFVPPDGPTTDQDIQDALQDEDMRQGDYLEDPENPHLNNLMKIGGAAAGFGGNLLRMLINPLGGNAMAMNFEDTGLSEGGFISTDKPHIYINRGAEAYILMPDGDFRFDGFYDPKRHGNAFPGLGLVQRNDNMKIAKLPHTPPTEKMVVGKKLMDSPLRFRTDDQREQYMLDYSKNFRYDGT